MEKSNQGAALYIQMLLPPHAENDIIIMLKEKPIYHNIVLRFGDGGKHIDAVRMDVSSPLGPVVDSMGPPPGQ